MVMWIDDDELRELFKSSSEERLQNIDAGLLHLEKYPGDQKIIESIMRDAHSLKGDSNMLGLKDIGTLSHQVEHILKAVQQGEQTLTVEVCDRLSHALQAISQMVQEAVTGEACGVNVFYVLAELMGAHPAGTAAPPTPEPAMTSPLEAIVPPPGDPAPPEDPPLTPKPEGELSPGFDPPPPDRPGSDRPGSDHSESYGPKSYGPGEDNPGEDSPGEDSFGEEIPPTFGPSSPLPKAHGYRIETIRVPTQNLDNLMTHAGELTVTKIRVAHRLGEIEAITTLWEEWNRDFFVNRFLFDEGKSTKNSKQQGQQLQQFYNRAEGYLQSLGNLAERLRSSLYEDITRLEMISDELEEGIRTLRLLPLSTLFKIFPRMVRDLARQEKKLVQLVIEGGETRADKRILEEMRDPLMHMIRNAIDHGVELPARRRQQGKPELATIILRSYQTPSSIIIEVEDDGKGLDLEAIKETALRRGLVRAEELETLTEGQIQNLILQPGFSTCTLVTEISGRGVGLDVLRSNVERLKGTIEVFSRPSQGCKIRIQLGTTLTTAHVMIVALQNRSYAIPVEFVQTACLVNPQEIFTIEGRETILYNQQPISVVKLTDLLELSTPLNAIPAIKKTQWPCIIVRSSNDRLGLFVDDLLDEQDVVLKPQSQLLKRVRNVSGATILGTGEVCMVLNPQDLIQSVRHKQNSSVGTALANGPLKQQHVVLLVEDSIATRTQEKRILEAAGYDVITAVDGMDGFNKLQTRSIDAVVSDVQMPNLDGLGLTERIRQHKEYNEIPVILVTTLASDEDRRRGAEAGANAYITKGSFTQDVLLDTLQRLI